MEVLAEAGRNPRVAGIVEASDRVIGAELREIIGNYEGLAIRSATKVTAEVLADTVTLVLPAPTAWISPPSETVMIPSFQPT